MSIAGLTETVVSGEQVAGAVKDTWNSDQNLQQDISIVKNSLGRFAFESALMTVGGFATMKLSSDYFRVKEYLRFSKKLGLSEDLLILDITHPRYSYKTPPTLHSLQSRITGYTTRQDKTRKFRDPC